ncbi:hypothetical protein [Methylocystis sp.]|uniref:hypothetical protein n=1 Tax=Methylocystis sp. TaxID=1911079 RepID=UPI003DA29813
MGRISEAMQEYAQGYAEGDFETIFGIPKQKGTGPGHKGTGGAPGTGPGWGPPQNPTEKLRFKLEELFHRWEGHFPRSEHEFQTWLEHNW